MSRVDFYILSGQDEPERFACALAGKIRRQGLTIHIHHDDRQAATMMDDLLWTYKDISFLPHALVDSEPSPDTPILLGWHSSARVTDEVLINLGKNIPDFAHTFARIIEIVAAQEPRREEARKRFRNYRDQGFEIHNHELEPKHA